MILAIYVYSHIDVEWKNDTIAWIINVIADSPQTLT